MKRAVQGIPRAFHGGLRRATGRSRNRVELVNQKDEFGHARSPASFTITNDN